MAICVLQSARVTVTRDLSVTKLKSCVCLVVAWLAYKRVTCDFPQALNRHEQQTWEARRPVDFWGNFYRVDKQDYTEDKLREEVAKCGLQTQLDGERRSHPVAPAWLHATWRRGPCGRSAKTAARRQLKRCKIYILL